MLPAWLSVGGVFSLLFTTTQFFAMDVFRQLEAQSSGICILGRIKHESATPPHTWMAGIQYYVLLTRFCETWCLLLEPIGSNCENSHLEVFERLWKMSSLSHTNFFYGMCIWEKKIKVGTNSPHIGTCLVTFGFIHNLFQLSAPHEPSKYSFISLLQLSSCICLGFCRA